jgi:lysophospholipase L1-like esterase
MRRRITLLALLVASIALAAYSWLAGRPAPAEIVILGDSILAGSDWPPAVANLAHPGDTIADQRNAYRFSPHRGMRAVIILLGMNDIHIARHDAPTIERELQELVDHVHRDNPGAVIYVSPLSPAKRYFDGRRDGAALYATWQAVNGWIAAGRLAGARVLAPAPLGDGALDPRYDRGDGMHLNREGRNLLGAGWRRRLEADGLILRP